MAITFVGGDSNDDGGGGTNTTAVNLTLPTHQADDVGYIFAVNSVAGASTTTFNSISGWTSVADHIHTTGFDGYMEIFRRVFTSSSETNPSVNTAIAAQKAAGVVVFRGVDTTTPEDVTPTETDGINNFNLANAAITPTNDSGIVLFQYVISGGAASRLVTVGAPATPSGLTVQADGSGSWISLENYRDIAVAHDVDGGSASTLYTPGAWTHTDGGGSGAESVNITLALRPASATGTTITVPTGPWR